MSLNNQAEALRDVVFYAFATHYNSTKRPGWSDAMTHWQNNPEARTLWAGLVKGIVTNISEAQKAGTLPPLLSLDVRTPLLPGLGGEPPRPDTSPGGLARRLAGALRDRQQASEARRRAAADARAATAPDSGLPAYHDTVPGLAVGRCTGDEAGDASDCSGSDGGSDGGGGGGD